MTVQRARPYGARPAWYPLKEEPEMTTPEPTAYVPEDAAVLSMSPERFAAWQASTPGDGGREDDGEQESEWIAGVFRDAAAELD
jgi:hypothetical protein